MLCKFGFLSKLLLSVDLKEYQGILGVRDLFGLAIGEPLCTCYFRRCGGHVLAHSKFCIVFY